LKGQLYHRTAMISELNKRLSLVYTSAIFGFYFADLCDSRDYEIEIGKE